MDLLTYLFDTTTFLTRDNCVRGGCCEGGATWEPWMVWAWVGSNTITAGVYLAIGTMLIFSWSKHRTLAGSDLLLWGAAFIAVCGAGHFVTDVLVFFWPAFRVFALMHCLTAIVSTGALLRLYAVLPALAQAVTEAMCLRKINRRLAFDLGTERSNRDGKS